MVKVFLSPNRREVYLEGNVENRNCQIEVGSAKTEFSREVKSFRDKNNFSYSSGEVKFDGCDNCVVLSDFEFSYIKNVRDNLVVANNRKVDLIPFSDLEKTLEIAEQYLAGRDIKYSRPQSVVLREDLVEKDIGKIRHEISNKYGLKPIEIRLINGGRTKFGVYYIRVESGEEFVLKYQGLKRGQIEVIADISNAYPNTFSRVKKRLDSGDSVFELEDGLYGLEEFVHGIANRDKTPRFYKQMGELIQRVHCNLNEFVEANPYSIQLLSTESRHLSESNLLALWIDLVNHREDYLLPLKIIRGLIASDVSNRVQNLPKKVIHGDMNRSNIIWNRKGARIVDKETIKISRRVMEFQIPLLFTGPRGFPEYTPKSLEHLLEGLTLKDESLTKEEFSLMGPLLKYCLIKNYVVRNIRRNLNQDERLVSLNLNLIKIGEELK